MFHISNHYMNSAMYVRLYRSLKSGCGCWCRHALLLEVWCCAVYYITLDTVKCEHILYFFECDYDVKTKNLRQNHSGASDNLLKLLPRFL